jgi:hypothetical protein
MANFEWVGGRVRASAGEDDVDSVRLRVEVGWGMAKKRWEMIGVFRAGFSASIFCPKNGVVKCAAAVISKIRVFGRW